MGLWINRRPRLTLPCSLAQPEFSIDLTAFFAELRRRKVVRTAAAYLAGAFVILQAADLTFEPLGFTSGAYRMLVIVAAVGFPLALVLSWMFDLRSEKPTTGPRHGSIAAAFLLLFAIGAFAWFATFRYKHADYDSSATMAIMPFQVLGGSQFAYLETGIVEMVSRNIDGAGNLRAVTPEAVIAVAKKKKPGNVVAKQLGARYLVTGNIAQAGQQLRITATVQDYKNANAKPITKEVTGSPDSLFDVVDRLSAQILASTRSGQDAHLSESAALTTKSLPALRAYLAGEEHYRRTQYDSASTDFSQAVALDSTFALAYYRLAVVQVQRGEAVPAREPLRRATQFGTRLSARDQGMLQSFALAFDGKWREAEVQLRDLLASYPDDLELMYNLGSLLATANPRHGKPVTEAITLYDKVLASDAQFFCPI